MAETIIGLLFILITLAALGFAGRFAFRALFRSGRKSAAGGARGSSAAAAELTSHLQRLTAQGFLLEDNGEGKLMLRLPLVNVASAAGNASEEYRITVKLDEGSRTAKLSESRIGKESGFGGGGFLKASTWKTSTSGGWKIEEKGVTAAPNSSGGSYHLDSESAKALVVKTIAEAGWSVR